MKKFEWKVEYRQGQLGDLSEADQLLVAQAKDSREHAYAPYSFYKVGAAVRLKSGEIVIGSNQENAAYPSGLCAERVAFFAAGAKYPESEFDTVAIVTKSDGAVPASSCGSCRQVMAEYEQRQGQPIRVIFADDEGNVLITNSVADLIPFAFEARRLG